MTHTILSMNGYSSYEHGAFSLTIFHLAVIFVSYNGLTLFFAERKGPRARSSSSIPTYAKEYLHKEKEQIRLKRAARTAADFRDPQSPRSYISAVST